jgi:hypothetical protein
MRFFTHDTSGGVPDFGERMRIDSSGDVGIGTSSPAKPLHVNSSTDEIFRLETSDNQTGNIYQAIHDASGELARIGMFDSSRILRLNNLQADGEVAFFTNNTERMRIDSSGDVGIGTSSPAKNLHVSSTGSPTFRIQDTDGSDYYAEIQQASGNTIFSSRFGASNGAFVFRGLGGGTADEHMRIDSSGDVGIGTTSPAATVDVSGNARGAVVTDNDLSFDLSASNNFNCTPTGGGTLTFTNHLAGQSGFVWLDNSGGHAIAAAGTTKINAADLTAISTAGVYTLSYFDNGTNAYVSVSRSFA